MMPDKIWLELVDLFMQARFRDLIEVSQEVLMEFPEESKLLNIVGLSYENEYNLKQAINFYNRAIKAMPENAVALFNLGNAYWKSKDNWAAISAYKTALSIEPDHETYLNLGNAQQEIGDSEGALDSYYAALQIAPDYPAVYINIGFILQESGNYQGATANYQRALELDPDNKTANAALGLALLSIGKIREGLKYQTAGVGALKFSLNSGVTIHSGVSS